MEKPPSEIELHIHVTLHNDVALFVRSHPSAGCDATLNFVVVLYRELAIHCDVALQCVRTLFSELALPSEVTLSG